MSNFATGYVEQFDDCGDLINSQFINANGASEGVSCSISGTNTAWVANNSGTLGLYNLGTGALITYSAPIGTFAEIADLSSNATGSVLYAADYGDGRIYALNPTTAMPLLSYGGATPGYAPAPNNSHDAEVGYTGDVLGTYFMVDNSGIEEYDPLLDNSPGVQFLPPGDFTPSTCPIFAGVSANGGQQCPENLAGMVADASGNIWASSTPKSSTWENGIMEFDPNGNALNFVPDPGALPIGLAIAPSNAPNAGNIIVANLLLGTVTQIAPSTCTGTIAVPGTCTMTAFFSTGGEPKYPRYTESCPNTANDGYVEVCKQSNPSFPVTGTFDFTVTAPYFSSGTVSVPVGECSGPVQVPSGTVTISEAPVAGVAVSDVTAYSYDPGYTDQLVAWTAPNPSATVTVEPGNDVALETIATFTNSAAEGQTGQLKICKTAGTGVTVGTPFSFATSSTTSKNKYTIEAGPASQGGYCELAGTYPIGSQVKVTETLPKGIYASIAVQPPTQAGKETANSVVVTIGQGITEVNFTDSTVKPSFTLGASPSELTVAPGAVGKSVITITPVNGFSGSVKLSATALNNATGKSVGTVTFSPNPATTTSTMIIKVSAKAETGAATITITGTSGSETETTTIALTVE
ncbi:MAG: hypothetical protein WBV46_00615 [Terriglobales bacterium]